MKKRPRVGNKERRRALLRKRKHLLTERRFKWFRLTQKDT